MLLIASLFVAFSALANVTIVIDDINDHAPKFTQSIYRATMSESLEVGASITSVSANDRDVGSNAKLMYSLRQQDREYFTIASIDATNTGVLKVHKVCKEWILGKIGRKASWGMLGKTGTLDI